MQAVDCQTKLAGQNAKPMALNLDDLTPALGQRSIRPVSPVGSGYAAGNVIARERLAVQWIQWPAQAGESLGWASLSGAFIDRGIGRSEEPASFKINWWKGLRPRVCSCASDRR